MSERIFQAGDKFSIVGESDIYLLSQVGVSEYALINLRSGNRYDEPQYLSLLTEKIICNALADKNPIKHINN